MSGLDVRSLGLRHCGSNVRIYPGAKIIGAEHIHIGDNVIIDDFVLIYATAPVFIGSYVHIASFTSIAGGGEVVLDDFSGLASGVRVVSGSEDFLGGGLTNPTVPSRFRKVHRSSVRIGRHAIVGANATLLPDVVVAEGCAVGANTLVSRSLEPWGVYSGVPARRVRARDSAEILSLEAELTREYPFEPLAQAMACYQGSAGG